jgi:hypothetical protein
MNRDYSEDLPDRNESSIPPQVQWFLSVCELATIYRPWLELNLGSEADNFCEGVVDYWWQHDELKKPTFEMIFHQPFGEKEWKLTDCPEQERIAYQKGAIIGYALAEEYDG